LAFASPFHVVTLVLCVITFEQSHVIPVVSANWRR
jgi:hypothetical protein